MTHRFAVLEPIGLGGTNWLGFPLPSNRSSGVRPPEVVLQEVIDCSGSSCRVSYTRRLAPSGTASQRLPTSQEVGTSAIPARSSSIRCAQRLSASQRSAQESSVAVQHNFGCSTPFGITEVGTDRSRSLQYRRQSVLNAFRHHRGRHREAGRHGRTVGDVLNAFRHHRGRHSKGSTHAPRNNPVLNAFRHHRGRHRRANLRRHRSRMCSTPFGITEVGTRRLRAKTSGCPRAQRLSASQRSAHGTGRTASKARRCAQRLSASQRSALPDDLPGFTFPGECSTPFGITEVGTLAMNEAGYSAEECSTPFGITEVGTRPRHDQSQGLVVLNAFRHHRGRHRSRPRR